MPTLRHAAGGQTGTLRRTYQHRRTSATKDSEGALATGTACSTRRLCALGVRAPNDARVHR